MGSLWKVWLKGGYQDIEREASVLVSMHAVFSMAVKLRDHQCRSR